MDRKEAAHPIPKSRRFAPLFVIAALLMPVCSCGESTKPPSKSELDEVMRRLGGLAQVDEKTQTLRVNMRGGEVEAAQLAELVQFQGIVELSLGGSNVGDEAMAEVAKLKRLRNLDVSVTRVTRKGLAFLEGLTGLTDLNVSHSKIHGVEFDCLSRFPVLRVLVLDRSQTTPATLRQFESLHSLETIYILDDSEKLKVWTRAGVPKGYQDYWKAPKGFTTLSRDYSHALETAVQRLGGQLFSEDEEPNANFVKLTGSKFESKRLEELVRFQSIVNLSLMNTNVDDAAMASVAKLKNLRSLYLSGTQVTSKGISLLGGLQFLAFLDLSEVGIRGTDFACLDELGSLKRLFLDKSQVTTTSLQYFDRHESLEDITLIDEKEMTMVNVWTRGLGSKGSEPYWKKD